MRLTSRPSSSSRRWLAAAIALIVAPAVVWLNQPSAPVAASETAVVLGSAANGSITSPATQPTSPAALAATLRASRSAPSPELLRGNREAQAAYDASAEPGDYVTPPSVSVEH